MDADLYDEFGNYIGPDLEEEEEEQLIQEVSHEKMDVDEPVNQIILHEDKQYYPDASEIYGENVETMVQEEDTQMLTVPIIAPEKKEKTFVIEKDLPPTRFKKEYLADLMNFPNLIRNVALVGHLHHGKTSLLDMFISDSHDILIDPQNPTRYTDIHDVERDRKITIKSMPMSLVMSNMRGKSHILNFMDTPGHINFSDEAIAALRICDGAILVVDVVEGVMANTERMIKQLVLEEIPIILCLNKLDRLILELKLPPLDAYFKLKHTIEEINSILSSFSSTQRLSPELGNVIFAAGAFGWCFSLVSFAKKYAEKSSETFDIEAFSRRLWGDIYFDAEKRNFRRNPLDKEQRTFIHFILEPLYKLHAQIVGEEPKVISHALASVGVYLKDSDLKSNLKPLISLACRKFFGGSECFTQLCIDNFKSPEENAENKLKYYMGDMTDRYSTAIRNCDPNGPLMIQIVKQYNAENMNSFDLFGRILSGTVTVGQKVHILGEGYSPEDDEDSSVKEITSLSIYESRYKIPINKCGAGNWVLLGGIDQSVVKTCTITDMDIDEEQPVHIFSPLKFNTQAVLKVAIEPVNPTELPKMLDGLRKVNKSYLLLSTKVEESGEHIIIGTGELYLDSVLYDLRKLYSDIDVKVSDPVVKFCETVVDTSAIKCWAETPNKKNKVTMICEPLEKGIAEDIESKKIDIKWNSKKLSSWFTENYEWDILASRNIWAFGPDDSSPNVLINDTLPAETDKKLLFSIKDSIKQGFQWGTREGPLTDEPVRNCKFRIIGADIAQEPIYRGGGQIIPTARRVCYSSFLMATPKLMEPVYFVEIQAPSDCLQAVYTVLGRRRGHVTQDLPKPGSPMYTIKALIPVIDSAGFETDLRTNTQGQAFCQQYFDHWQIVPGDPLDKDIVLRPLEPSQGPQLARDFLIKTRRRKGLSEDVAITKFFDDPMLVELVKLNTSLLR